MRGTWSALIGAAALAGAPSAAQTPQPTLDYSNARTMVETCIAWAEERDLAVAIAVFAESGKLLAFAHMDGAATAVGEFAQWKGRSAATVHFASSETANWGNGPPSVATWEGGLPIFTADGIALGGVGVSGAESVDDTACARAGIASAGLRDAAE